MRNLSVYIVLVLVFLGLSKSFNISSKGTEYLYNENGYSGFFPGSPLSVILAERFETGFLIKTYYHRYLLIEGVNTPKYVTVRTSPNHYNAYEKYVGLSVFRRTDRSFEEDKTPLPPGSLYLGNPAYGSWKRNRKTGDKKWEFHRAYKNYVLYFAWGDFRPDYEFFQKLQESVKFEKPFYGVNEEFGSKGEISLKFFNKHNLNAVKDREDIKALFNKLLSSPPWNLDIPLRELIKQQNKKTKVVPE
jgi:hypothetical protein